jgi:hypothetical protein
MSLTVPICIHLPDWSNGNKADDASRSLFCLCCKFCSFAEVQLIMSVKYRNRNVSMHVHLVARRSMHSCLMFDLLQVLT